VSADNATVLRQLFPLDLGGVFQDDLAVDGRGLDAAQERAERLLIEMFADSTYELLASFERMCGITPADDWAFQLRRDMVVRKLRDLGDIKRPHFVALAAVLGYQVEIDDYVPFMANWGRAGDRIYIVDAIYIWQVAVLNQPTYFFRAGQAVAGNRVQWWAPATVLEDILNDIKPADVYMHFVYP
jgi:uncharacterized protein YmfQ (DUF2313 family)